MATVTKLQEFGNQVAVLFSDGSKVLAYPTGQGIWLVAPNGDGGTGAVAVWPFDPATVSSEFRSADRPNHDGIDFAFSGIGGSPIPNSVAGTVVTRVVNFGNTSWGNYVVVESVVEGDTLRCLYAHMATEPPVQLGQSVAQGETLGPVGTTGSSTGNHLHWETRINGTLVNPRDFMAVYG